MPFIGKLRKEISRALDNQIIPALKQGYLPLAYVDFPLEMPLGIKAWRESDKVLSEEVTSSERWATRGWLDEDLIFSEYPYIGFVFEGTAHVRTALTAQKARSLKANKNVRVSEPGIYVLELPSPCVVFYPPGTPHHTGHKVFWEQPHLEEARMKFFSIRLFPSMILVHLSWDQDGRHFVEHPLQINDPDLILLVNIFAEELQFARQDNQETARMCLLIILTRLKRSIDTAPFANTSWPATPDFSPDARDISPQSLVLFDAAINFIQLRMHEKLTLTRIARSAGVSPQHLNRVFSEIATTTVMRYVVSQRIEAAKAMLQLNDAPIKEIAGLVGFDRYTTFCKAFLREVKQTPKSFRQSAKHHSL